MRVDLNADLGESPQRWATGEDVALLQVVTSASVCCGAYAGGEDLMASTCEGALTHGVAIGAQVGYRDRENFGRARVDIADAELTREVVRQMLVLDGIARSAGGRVSYVKPHGALYNRIVDDDAQARAVVDAIMQLPDPLPLVGLPGSVSLEIAAAAGLRVVLEGFADRAYTPQGRLVPRNEAGAVLEDAEAVAAQAVGLLGSVESICVHSDSPGALGLARAARSALEAAGAEVRSVAP